MTITEGRADRQDDADESTAGRPTLATATGDTSDLASLEVVPVRKVGRWIASVVVAVLVAQVIHGFVDNPTWDWAAFGEWFFHPSVLEGLLVTVKLALLAAVFGFAGGVVLATMRQSKSPLLQGVAWTYTWIFRSVPLIVQVLLWGNIAALYRVISIGVPFGPAVHEFRTLDLIGSFTAAVIALSLHEAAFASEVVRAGILSVDQGQTEAASALGLPRLRQLRRIILPQAMRAILPNAVNQIVNLVKATSVVYILAIGELFYTVQVIYGRTTKVIPLLIVATVWYIVLTTVLSVIQFYVERHYARGAVRTLPDTPLQRLRASAVDLSKFRGATR